MVLSRLLFSALSRSFVCSVVAAVVILNLELLARPPADLCKMTKQNKKGMRQAFLSPTLISKRVNLQAG